MTTLAPQLFPVAQERMTSDDYYTPAWVFERLAIDFDLDVASPPGGIPWIPTKRYFTMEDDGLSQPWEGRVWMNPPYSDCTPWVDRLIEHGHGIALVMMSKGAWFHRLWNAADGMVNVGAEGSKFVGGAIYMPTVFAAFGDDCVEAIARLGRVR